MLSVEKIISRPINHLIIAHNEATSLVTFSQDRARTRHRRRSTHSLFYQRHTYIFKVQGESAREREHTATRGVATRSQLSSRRRRRGARDRCARDCSLQERPTHTHTAELCSSCASYIVYVYIRRGAETRRVSARFRQLYTYGTGLLFLQDVPSLDHCPRAYMPGECVQLGVCGASVLFFRRKAPPSWPFLLLYDDVRRVVSSGFFRVIK